MILTRTVCAKIFVATALFYNQIATMETVFRGMGVVQNVYFKMVLHVILHKPLPDVQARLCFFIKYLKLSDTQLKTQLNWCWYQPTTSNFRLPSRHNNSNLSVLTSPSKWLFPNPHFSKWLSPNLAFQKVKQTIKWSLSSILILNCKD